MWPSFRKGNHICWPDAKQLEAHFDARHRRRYDEWQYEWQCQNVGERVATTEEICPSIDAPLSGVWADPVLLRPTAMPMDPMAMPRDPTAMPGPTAALQQGDSPEATRHEPPRLIFAAQQLLQTLYSDQGGYAVRPVSELLRKMAIPIRARENMVNRIAYYRQGPWTAQQWLDWYKSEPLSNEDFEWAKSNGKEFPMNSETRKQIAEWKSKTLVRVKRMCGSRLTAPLVHSFNKSA